MEVRKLKDMVRGWFVGNFEPSCFSTEVVEVAVKNYKAGDKEAAHYHKIATEITEILSGKVRMNETELIAGDIAIVYPGEIVEFEALEDSSNVVVKIPGALNDKYLN